MTAVDLDVDDVTEVAPLAWCYRCAYEHPHPCVLPENPRTAAAVAWSAFCQAIDAVVGVDVSAREASPEVLDLIAAHCARVAAWNREVTA